MKAMIIVLIATLCLCSGIEAFAQSMVKAKKKNVKILKEADKKSDVIKTLDKGDEVQAGERKGMYWTVTVDGKPGFVSVMNVKRVPGGDKGGLNEILRSAVTEGREDDEEGSSRARSAVMGVRGLDESGDAEFAGNVKPNMRLVYNMEDIIIEESEIENFGEQIFAEIEAKAQ